MCLLITKKINSPKLADHWLEDFYSSNADGIGIMYAENNELIVKKILPKNEKESIGFYQDHVLNKNCAIHFRMRTHGNTDLSNCHPYEILNKKEHGADLWLMHNGILSTGNAKDVNMSDTWHYIQDFLKPMLLNNVDYAFTDSFKRLIGSHIGSSNKFVIMDHLGRMTTINASSGVYWAGLWLSNTYAWSAPSKVSKTYVKNKKQWKIEANSKIELYSYKGYKGYKGFNEDYDDLYDNYPSHQSSYKNNLQMVTTKDYLISDEDLFEIENSILDLSYWGFQEVQSITMADIEDFIEYNRIKGFYDLYEDLINYNITENDFIDAIYNPSRHYQKSLNHSLVSATK